MAGVPGATGPAGAPATTLFAHIRGDNAALLYGNGVTGTEDVATGDYRVTFNQDLTDCVPIATVGDTAGAGGLGGNVDGKPTIFFQDGGANTVRVQIANVQISTLLDSDFFLAVFC